MYSVPVCTSGVARAFVAGTMDAPGPVAPGPAAAPQQPAEAQQNPFVTKLGPETQAKLTKTSQSMP